MKFVRNCEIRKRPNFYYNFLQDYPFNPNFQKFLHGYDNFLWGYVGKGFFFLPCPFVGAKEKGGLLQSQNMVLSDV